MGPYMKDIFQLTMESMGGEEDIALQVKTESRDNIIVFSKKNDKKFSKKQIIKSHKNDQKSKNIFSHLSSKNGGSFLR